MVWYRSLQRSLRNWGGTHPDGRSRIVQALADGWLQVTAPPKLVPLPFRLDAGETEAIALAVQVKSDVLLIDEKKGRQAARHFGLVVAGVLGELIHAKNSGWIPTVREEIQSLRREARFFVDAGIEHFILSQVGE